MGTGVMGYELGATGTINFTLDGHACDVNILANLSVNNVHDNLANFDAVNDLKFTNTFDRKNSSVVDLATRSRVEGTLIQDDQVALVFLEHIGVSCHCLGFKF